MGLQFVLKNGKSFFAKFFRQTDDVLVVVTFGAVVVVVVGKRRGLEQQAWHHTCSTSLKQGEYIAMTAECAVN